MPYFPTSTPGPKAILANPGSVTWLLGGQSLTPDANGIQTVFGEALAAGATIAASPAFNQGRSVNTYSVQSYILTGAATVALQGSMTNTDADFVTLTAVNGVYSTNLPFIRALLSGITTGTGAVAIIF